MNNKVTKTFEDGEFYYSLNETLNAVARVDYSFASITTCIKSEKYIKKGQQFVKYGYNPFQVCHHLPWAGPHFTTEVVRIETA